MIKYLLFLLLCLFLPLSLQAKTVRYELNVTRESVNLSGHKNVDWALMVNQSIPAPVLEFTEGDEAEIVVNNRLLDEEVSIHWHGLLLPPEMDGVAYVNTPPIFPGGSHTFRFTLRQHGTYWYHSHTMVQEQKGVYGAFIVHPKKKTFDYDKELVVVLSDWSDENADDIIKNLRKDGEYYAYKKKTLRSWWGALRAGAFGTLIGNEWTRMGGMDLSDVGYDAFLINGRRDSQLLVSHPGEKIRLRLINAAASSYFYVSLAGLPMKVVSADGVDIEPISAKELLMGMAETYDIVFESPEHKNYELRATVQDVTGYASGWIGMGEKVAAPDKPYPDLYSDMHADHAVGAEHSSDHSQHHHAAPEASTEEHHHHGHHHHGHDGHSSAVQATAEVESLTVDQIKSAVKTSFPLRHPRHDARLVLGGDMERYVWHINGKAIHQDRNIEIKEGDVVRFTFVNETMMHHPMHLHGHFFRVLTDAGEYSPLKHTVDVGPHSERTIEFLANEPGEWMLHCHNLYHMKTGMTRVVKYSSFTPQAEIAAHQKHDPHLHDHIYFAGAVEAFSNHGKVALKLSKTWDEVELHAESREYDNFDHFEAEALYSRWFSNFFRLTLGATHYSGYAEDETRGVFGVGYVLPLLIESRVLVDHLGKFRLDLEKHFQWTSRVYSEAEVSFREQEKAEFEISLMYASRWDWSLGLLFTEEDIGAGFRYRF